MVRVWVCPPDPRQGAPPLHPNRFQSLPLWPPRSISSMQLEPRGSYLPVLTLHRALFGSGFAS